MFDRMAAVPDGALSVAGVTQYLQALIEQDPVLHRVWVVGEIANVSDRNGHLFMTLQEPDGTATLQAIAWKSIRPKLTVEPEAGTQVFVLGQLRVYAQRGQYQLTALQILPAGEGLQALRRRQLYQRLATEGVFDDAVKRPLPPFPNCLAVVTSAQAAAWGDIQRTLRERHPGLRVLLSTATVQGATAPESIVAALARVVADGRAEVIILARGGGAREDLNAFDDERVVRAIADCPIPIITGIGHQRDETLADLTADFCAHTPTAAAERAVPSLADLWLAHRDRTQRLSWMLQSTLQRQTETLTILRRRLTQVHPEWILRQEQQRLQHCRDRLYQVVQHRLQREHQRCTLLKQTLKTLDPESILRRGYALVRTEGDRLLEDASTVSPGDRVYIQLAYGSLTAQVLSHEP